MKMKFICLAALCLLLFTGCEQAGKQDSEVKAIKVMYYDAAEFKKRYETFYSDKMFEPIVIETKGILTSSKSFDEYFDKITNLIKDKKPNVILFAYMDPTFHSLVSENMIYELDDLIRENNYDLTEFVEPTVNELKIGERLLGLPSSFTSTALFYNKSLLDSRQLLLDFSKPISWNEILEAAKKMTGTEYGILDTMNDPFYLITTIASASGIPLLHPDGISVNITSTEWEQLFEYMIPLFKTNAILTHTADHSQQFDEQLKNHPFIKGDVAFTIGNSSLLLELEEAADIPQLQVPEWNIASLPVPRNGEGFHYNRVTPTNIWSITSFSGDKDSAWEFIELLTSKEVMKASPKMWDNLPARYDLIEYDSSINIEAFYSSQNPVPKTNAVSTQDIINSIRPIANEEISLLIEGKRTVKESLLTIQEVAQKFIDSNLGK